MDGNNKSQAKLTRTHSSLLRSSPTIRSSIHSLSSMNEITEEQLQQDDVDVEEQKPHNKPGSNPVRSGSTRFAPVLALLLLFLYTLFAYYLRDETPASESVLLVLVFVAVLVFTAGKHTSLIKKMFRVSQEYLKRVGLCLCCPTSNAKPVHWFIGDLSHKKSPSFVGGGNGEEEEVVKEGVEFFGNGDFYEGEFYKGKCNGSGVYSYLVNGRYEGDWIDGKYDGYGIESWARGSRYRGQYRQGLRHGYGVYRFYTGDCYAGEWFHGQGHGVGVQTCSDGSCFVGEFKCGVKHGLGCYHFRNGDKYAGEYFGDKIHGFGVYHFANGHCYEGSWHEGRKQGYGMYTFRNGDSRCGEWDCGTLKTALPPLTEATLRAVQAARRTAENAIHLRRVDDHVNKAVTSANKAATAARVAAVKAVQNRIDGKFCETHVV